MKFRLFALLSACVLLLPLVSCVRRDRLPDRPAFSAGSGLGAETDSDGAPVLRRSSGSARSAESRYLVLLLDWELKQTATDSKTAQPTVTVTVTVSLSHYSLQVGARNGGYVSLGGERRAFSTPPAFLGWFGTGSHTACGLRILPADGIALGRAASDFRLLGFRRRLPRAVSAHALRGGVCDGGITQRNQQKANPARRFAFCLSPPLFFTGVDFSETSGLFSEKRIVFLPPI